MFEIGQRVQCKKWYCNIEGTVLDKTSGYNNFGDNEWIYMVKWDNEELAEEFILNRPVFEHEIKGIAK